MNENIVIRQPHSAMNVLVLEDAQYRIESFRKMFKLCNLVISEDTAFVINELKKNKWDILFLDHDLHGEIHVPSGPDTGWEICKFLLDNPDCMPKRVVLHSHNRKGVEEMKKILPSAEVRSFGTFIWRVNDLEDVDIKLC